MLVSTVGKKLKKKRKLFKFFMLLLPDMQLKNFNFLTIYCTQSKWSTISYTSSCIAVTTKRIRRRKKKEKWKHQYKLRGIISNKIVFYVNVNSFMNICMKIKGSMCFNPLVDEVLWPHSFYNFRQLLTKMTWFMRLRKILLKKCIVLEL